MISKILVTDFIEILGRYELQTPDTIVQFPLEYYIEEDSVYLYKTIMTKTYSTQLILNNNTLTLNGEVITLDSFITTFLRNHNAIQILELPETQANVSFKIEQE